MSITLLPIIGINQGFPSAQVDLKESQFNTAGWSYKYKNKEYNMAKKKRFSLDIAKIEATVQDYFNMNTQFSYQIMRHDNTGMFIEIEKGKSNGQLTLYYTGGQVSASPQGRMAQKAEELWEYIRENSLMPNVDHKIFVLRDIDRDDFSTYIECLTEDGNLTITQLENKDPNAAYRYEILNKYGARLTLTYYTNGTVLMQGLVTGLFINMIIETITTISTIPHTVLNEILSIDNAPPAVIDPDLSKHISNLLPISGTLVERCINSSITLINSAKPLDEYSSYTFGILRGLDGLIGERIKRVTGVPFPSYGTYFDTHDKINYYIKTTDFDHIPIVKSLLEKAYTYLFKYRNNTFHVNRVTMEASMELTYDEAYDVIKETLTIIDELCNNW